ncbi:adenosine deaminase family protein [Amnibacterium sp.]|uniref:adenosine deaminase family protein n=1 Tax=Amnibacterium sp. TaxID=1872496 RepID=UPI0026260630|nr:adenosine deaminase family protein [Amnibacterium sp.]MCU1473030.1 adenosine deaminase [Amnibacterium sp.]
MTEEAATTSPEARQSLRALPKAHLHAHLDGSYPLPAVQALAARRGARFEVPSAFVDVWQFFDHYGTVPALVQSNEDLAELCRALVHAEAAEGVLYLEPAIEPQLYAPRLGSLEQVTRTMLSAFREASDDSGVEVGANLTINTDEDLAISADLARIAAAHAGAGVTALGTAGFVEPGHLRRYREAARIGRAAGLPVVSHAGQTGGPDSIEEALDELGATRISHGFRAVESAQLLDRLARDHIVCDVCPVSNVALGVVKSLAEHPAPRLRAAGVPVTLNADDSLWFSRSVTDQYEIARSVWQLDDEDLAAFARAGTLATGMSDTTRRRLETGVAAWLAEGSGR